MPLFTGADNPSKSLRHICAMSFLVFPTQLYGLFDACEELPLLILQGKDDLSAAGGTLYDELAACEGKQSSSVSI